jgi:MFS family permease
MKGTRRNIFLAYLFAIFYGTTLTSSVWMIFYFNRGFSLADIMILDAIYQAALVLCEIPSGLLADRWGRKKTLLLGCGVIAVRTLAVVFYGFSLIAVGLLWVIEGFGKAMFTDTINSLIYDSLPKIGREKKFASILARFNGIYCVAYGAGALGGSLLTTLVPLPTLYAMGAIFCGLAFIIALFMKEPKRVSRAQAAATNIVSLLHKSYLTIKQSKQLTGLIFYASFVGLIYYLFWEYYQPYLERMGLPIALFGVVVIAMSAVEGAVPLLAGRLLRGGKKQMSRLFAGALIVIAGLVMVFSWAVGWLGLAALLAIIGLTSLLMVMADAMFQKEVMRDCRTTTKSVQTVVYRVMIMLVVLLASAALEKIDFLTMFKIFGGLILTIGVIYSARVRRR